MRFVGFAVGCAFLAMVACKKEGESSSSSAPADSVVEFRKVAAGDSECPAGGLLLYVFLDVNRNGVFDEGLDKSQKMRKVCSGVPGTAGPAGKAGVNGVDGADGTAGADGAPGLDGLNGESGHNSVILTETVPQGDAECAAGGVEFISFTDMNDNGTFESDADQNHSSRKICHGTLVPPAETPVP